MSEHEALQPGTPVVLHGVYTTDIWDGETARVAGDPSLLWYTRVVLDNPRSDRETLLVLPREFTVLEGKK